MLNNTCSRSSADLLECLLFYLCYFLPQVNSAFYKRTFCISSCFGYYIQHSIPLCNCINSWILKLTCKFYTLKGFKPEISETFNASPLRTCLLRALGIVNNSRYLPFVRNSIYSAMFDFWIKTHFILKASRKGNCIF